MNPTKLVPQIFPVTCHTDHVGQNSTFIVLQGRINGINFIPLALKKGARTFVLDHEQRTNFQQICCCGTLEKNECPNCGVRYEFVNNARQEVGLRTAQALNFPAKKLQLIAITGTKGKTTTTHLIHHILNHAGYKTALIGGIYNKIGTELYEESYLTTPIADYLQMFLAQCVKQEVKYVVMEASSHALDLGRLYGLEFDSIGFTNLGQDHLDYHQTMDQYFTVKLQIFKQLKPDGSAVINTSNSWGKKAFELCMSKKTETNFIIEQNSLEGLTIKLLPNNITLSSNALFGPFNAENIAMAATIGLNFGLSITQINLAVATFQGTPGRLQKHRLKNGATAFVDFAHNPSSFEAVLSALRPLTNHLLVIFGCGGNRDTTKRPLMGNIAATYGDIIFITNDNPRFENEMTIINDIKRGITTNKPLYCNSDRKKTIEQAVALSHQGSIIALLGKGHEKQFLIQGEKFEFDDFEQISRF